MGPSPNEILEKPETKPMNQGRSIVMEHGRTSTLKKRDFRLGELVGIKDSVFQISNISRHSLTLRLQPERRVIG